MWTEAGFVPGADEQARLRLTRALDSAGADGLIATTPENVYYLTGFFGLPEWAPRLTQVYAVWRPDEPPALIVPRSELDLAAEFASEQTQVYPYGAFFYVDGQPAGAADKRLSQWGKHYPDQWTALEAALSDLGRTGRLAVDEAGLAPGGWERIKRIVSPVPAYDLIRSVRMIKSAREIEILAHLAQVTESASWDAIAATHAGDTELDVARRLHERLAAYGAWPEVTVIASGNRAAYPNGPPTSRCLTAGDIIRLDICAFVPPYHSDIARTATVGKAGDEERRIYEALVAGQDAALSAVRPGATAAGVFHAGVSGARAAGLPDYQRHHCGHGIGLEGYDPPIISAACETVLEPGMVLCVELPYYRLGHGGLQVEDTVVVTETGMRMLTQSSRDLWLVGE